MRELLENVQLPVLESRVEKSFLDHNIRVRFQIMRPEHGIKGAHADRRHQAETVGHFEHAFFGVIDQKRKLNDFE
jgi:hypothetical protein